MRNKGEGSFFYDHSAGRWVGKIGSIKVTSKDKTAAKAKWDAAKQKHAAGGKTSTAPRIADLLEALTDQKRQQSKTASTVGWYEGLASTHLAPLVGVRADSLSVEDVEDWLAERTHLTTNYLNRLRGALAQALDVGIRRRQIVWNPAALAQVPLGTQSDSGEVLHADEVRNLLKAAQGDRMEAWLQLMLDAGLRPHESYELIWGDVDFDSSTVTARPRKSKANKPRIVRISPATRSLLAAHRTAQTQERLLMGDRWPREHDALVFRSESGTPMNPRNMNRRLKGWLEKAGINKHLHAYDLRATVASIAAAAGVPVVKLADYLGNLPTTLEKHYRQPVTPVMELGFDVTEASEKVDLIDNMRSRKRSLLDSW